MRRFVEEADRGQWTLLPECLDDFIDESNPVRVIDAFVEALDLAEMSFEGVEPAATGRPSYHPSVLLKLYIYGYLNRVQSSRRREREAGRNDVTLTRTGEHLMVATTRPAKPSRSSINSIRKAAIGASRSFSSPMAIPGTSQRSTPMRRYAAPAEMAGFFHNN